MKTLTNNPILYHLSTINDDELVALEWLKRYINMHDYDRAIMTGESTKLSPWEKLIGMKLGYYSRVIPINKKDIIYVPKGKLPRGTKYIIAIRHPVCQMSNCEIFKVKEWNLQVSGVHPDWWKSVGGDFDGDCITCVPISEHLVQSNNNNDNNGNNNNSNIKHYYITVNRKINKFNYELNIPAMRDITINLGNIKKLPKKKNSAISQFVEIAQCLDKDHLIDDLKKYNYVQTQSEKLLMIDWDIGNASVRMHTVKNQIGNAGKVQKFAFLSPACQNKVSGILDVINPLYQQIIDTVKKPFEIERLKYPSIKKPGINLFSVQQYAEQDPLYEYLMNIYKEVTKVIKNE